MNIVIASSEVAPFSKTGGLADVCGSLPRALERLGQTCRVVTPAYRSVYQTGIALRETGLSFTVPIGSKHVTAHVVEGHLPGSGVPIYLIAQPEYYDRRELYREDGHDYRDNCERFIFFCRALLELARIQQWPVDVLHVNDWQTGLVPAYLRVHHEISSRHPQTASVLTIHNMAYQGQFWHWDMLLTGLDWKYFNWRQMEFFGKLNLLKTGIVFADAITTVSPRYAQEIQRQPLGCGLEGVLQHRRDDLYGIINGVDYDVWDPARDSLIPQQYDVDCWREGKRACRRALRDELGLPQRDDWPLIGLIGRLADQKGWDLVAQAMKRWVTTGSAQWVILGTGEPVYHELLNALARSHPDRVAVRLEFSDRWAHCIEAGADMFLMPSRFEPCGLNQLYSLKYGTVPIVHATGGLADTITDAAPEHLASGTANGFCFTSYSVDALEQTLHRACNVFRNEPTVWEQLVRTGMLQDWSWEQSARRYVDVYHAALSKRRG